MSSESFDFAEPDHVAAGAIGLPGERVFYLQARQDGHVVSLRLEKQQVAALCEYLGGILNDLAVVAEPLPAVDLIEPVVAEWVVGALAVAYEEADDRILLVAEEFVAEDETDADETDVGAESGQGTSGSGGDANDGADDAAIARFRLTRAQVHAMITHASRVVAAGRPICQVCGRPMEPDGHFCPRNN